jgi:hypothetical protein
MFGIMKEGKFLASIICLLLSGHIASAQAVSKEDSTYSAVAYWTKKDTMVYDVVLEKYRVKGKDTTITMYYSYSIHATVQDSTEKSYILACRYEMDSLYSESKLADEIAKEMGAMTCQVASELGMVIGVKNWQEVSASMLGGIRKLKSKRPSTTVADRFYKTQEELFSSKKFVEGNTILDIFQMFYFHGLEYKLGVNVDIDDERKSNYSDKMLSVKGKIVFDSLYYDDGVARMDLYEEFDTEEVSTELKSYFVKTLGQDPKDVKNVKVELVNYNTTYIDVLTGWVINSFETKYVTTDGVEDVQTRSIRLR